MKSSEVKLRENTDDYHQSSHALKDVIQEQGSYVNQNQILMIVILETLNVNHDPILRILLNEVGAQLNVLTLHEIMYSQLKIWTLFF